MEHVPVPKELPPRRRSTRAPADPHAQIKKEIVRGIFGLLRKRL
jgi:hypothetical protein